MIYGVPPISGTLHMENDEKANSASHFKGVPGFQTNPDSNSPNWLTSQKTSSVSVRVTTTTETRLANLKYGLRTSTVSANMQVYGVMGPKK